MNNLSPINFNFTTYNTNFRFEICEAPAQFPPSADMQIGPHLIDRQLAHISQHSLVQFTFIINWKVFLLSGCSCVCDKWHSINFDASQALVHDPLQGDGFACWQYNNMKSENDVPNLIWHIALFHKDWLLCACAFKIQLPLCWFTLSPLADVSQRNIDLISFAPFFVSLFSPKYVVYRRQSHREWLVIGTYFHQIAIDSSLYVSWAMIWSVHLIVVVQKSHTSDSILI